MKILGYYLYASDFVPPIVNKVVRKVQKLLAHPSETLAPPSETQARAPFDSVFANMDVKWILDVGANQGLVTIAGLTTYKNSKAIYFEPVKETFQQLKSNLAPYEDRVVLYKQALSEFKSNGIINLTSHHGANSIESQSEFHQKFNPHVRETGQEPIELVRLDDVALNFPTKYIDIMKIDVEGHELSVLKGGAQFISTSVDTIIIEIALQRDTSWENQSLFGIFELLNKWGFRLINVYDLHRANNSNMLLVQMDCVFRHKSKLSS